MSEDKQFFIANHHGSRPGSYIGILLNNNRDENSWWLRLVVDGKDATLWTLERHAHVSGQVKLSTMAGGHKLFLTAHGNSCKGSVAGCGTSCFAALVHEYDDDNVIWTEETVNVSGEEGKILRKTALTNLVFFLAGACYPRCLPAHGDLTEWNPLPGCHGIIVKTPVGHWNNVDMTTV